MMMTINIKNYNLRRQKFNFKLRLEIIYYRLSIMMAKLSDIKKPDCPPTTRNQETQF
jgi:hypothetical protein